MNAAKCALFSLAALFVLAPAGQAAATIPAKITAPFHARAVYFASHDGLTCYQAKAAYRCIFYRPVPADWPTTVPFEVKLPVNGKPVRATIRGGVQITHRAGCTWLFQHLGTSLDFPAPPSEAVLAAGYPSGPFLVNTCAAGWAAHLSMP